MLTWGHATNQKQCMWSQEVSGLRLTAKSSPPIHLHDPSIKWLCKVSWQTKSLYLHWRKSMDAKLGTLLSYREKLPPLSHLTLWSCNQNEITNILISTVKRLMATKHGRVLTNGRRLYLQTLKSSSTSCFINS